MASVFLDRGTLWLSHHRGLTPPRDGNAGGLPRRQCRCSSAFRCSCGLLGNPQYGCELAPIDFAAVAEACGIRGYHITEPGDTPKILAEALAHDGPALIMADVDAYEAPFADTFKPTHMKKLVTAFERGEKGRQAMATSLLQPGVVEISPGVQAVQDDLAKYT